MALHNLYVCQRCGEEVGEGEATDYHGRHAYCGGQLDPAGAIDVDDEEPLVTRPDRPTRPWRPEDSGNALLDLNQSLRDQLAAAEAARDALVEKVRAVVVERETLAGRVADWTGLLTDALSGMKWALDKERFWECDCEPTHEYDTNATIHQDQCAVLLEGHFEATVDWIRMALTGAAGERGDGDENR
jgi:hypothetical protein